MRIIELLHEAISFHAYFSVGRMYAEGAEAGFDLGRAAIHALDRQKVGAIAALIAVGLDLPACRRTVFLHLIDPFHSAYRVGPP